MRTSTLLVAACAALALAACGQKDGDKTAAAEGKGADAAANAPAGSPMNPTPKPGLWQQTTSGDGVGTMTMKVCLDEALAAKATAAGNQMQKDMCSEYDMRQGPGGAWNIKSTCDMGTGGKIQSNTRATGDLTSDYRVEIDSVTTGAEAPQMNGARKQVMEAKWLGPCPADMPPGAIDMGGVIIDRSGMKGAR